VIGVDDLPPIDAALNGLAAALLTTGWFAIRSKRVTLHKRCMVSAFATSTLFLCTYLTHKALVHGHHTPFPGEGAARAIYLSILLSHTVLAVVTVPLAIVTLRRGLRGDLARHKRLARVTLPIWLYVSVTGVVVWWMLYGGAFGPAARAS
jgi:putative membrane protein